jgi:hypothetical protein
MVTTTMVQYRTSTVLRSVVVVVWWWWVIVGGAAQPAGWFRGKQQQQQQHHPRTTCTPPVQVNSSTITNDDIGRQRLLPTDDEAENILTRFFRTIPTGSSSTSTKFHIQGWRWHTMSLVHEARRLHQLATKLLPQQQQHPTTTTTTASRTPNFVDLQTVAEYTVDFNMRALHRIERDLFFPWIRKKTRSVAEQDVVHALDAVLNQLDKDRNRMESLGSLLVSSFCFCFWV